jgi:hypothetical protein
MTMPIGVHHVARRRQHKHHQQPIGRDCGKRRQPLAFASRQGTFHQPASGQGQAGDQGSRRQLALLAAEAEGGSGTEQRQGDGC